MNVSSKKPLLFTIAIFVALCLAFCRTSPAQTACAYPPTETNQGSWPQGQVVTVNIDPNFTPAQQQAIQMAFNTWQNAGGRQGITPVSPFNS